MRKRKIFRLLVCLKKVNENEQRVFADERIVVLGGNKWLLKLLNKTLYIKKEAVSKSFFWSFDTASLKY